MFNDDYKTIQRMRPMLQKVLIVDPQPASARLIGDLMRATAQSTVVTTANAVKGLAEADFFDPQLVFVELNGPNCDGADFTRRLRRSEFACRQTPVIATTSAATAAGILAARDAGVHEFLRKPFTTKDLLRRLEAVTLRPRDWIEAVSYVGPDRRRFNSGDYSGPLKRRSDAREMDDQARKLQALKILKSAVAAVPTDPLQAMRAMQAQAVELQKVAVSLGDLKLSTATADFQRYLRAASEKGGVVSGEVDLQAGPLLGFLAGEKAAAPQTIAV